MSTGMTPRRPGPARPLSPATQRGGDHRRPDQARGRARAPARQGGLGRTSTSWTAFCPQLTVGPAFVAAVASTGIPVDAHLIIEEPRRLLPEIAAAGAAVITVHAEATRHLHRTMAEMTALAGDERLHARRGHQPGHPGAGGRAGARGWPTWSWSSRSAPAGPARRPRPAPGSGSTTCVTWPGAPEPTCWSAWTAE